MQRGSKRGAKQSRALLGAAVLILASAAHAEPDAVPAQAEPGSEPAQAAPDPTAPEPPAPVVTQGGAVPLDRLLRLPTGTGQGSALERRGGLTKAEWETRFREARSDQVEAREAIERTRAAIEKKVAQEGGGQWRMGAPGMIDVQNTSDGADSPLDYKLTQTLRRNREELARADRALQDLQVEANLASVPAIWRALPDETDVPKS